MNDPNKQMEQKPIPGRSWHVFVDDVETINRQERGGIQNSICMTDGVTRVKNFRQRGCVTPLHFNDFGRPMTAIPHPHYKRQQSDDQR